MKNYSVVNLIPRKGNVESSYTISPALPSGLLINSATGVISGTPTVSAAKATYTVTASNPSRSTSFDIVITINNQPSRIIQVLTWDATKTKLIRNRNYSYKDNLISQIEENYKYDDLNTYIYITKIYYNSGKLNSIYSESGDRYGLSSYTTNFYYTGDLITSNLQTILPRSQINYEISHKYVYANGKVINYIPNNDTNTMTTYEYYTDGNLFKKTDLNYSPNSSIYYSYDSKNNPLRLGGFTSEYLTINAAPVNNPTAKNNETYVYEYNSFDYPEKKTTFINGVIQSIAIYTYE